MGLLKREGVRTLRPGLRSNTLGDQRRCLTVLLRKPWDTAGNVSPDSILTRNERKNGCGYCPQILVDSNALVGNRYTLCFIKRFRKALDQWIRALRGEPAVQTVRGNALDDRFRKIRQSSFHIPQKCRIFCDFAAFYDLLHIARELLRR